MKTLAKRPLIRFLAAVGSCSNLNQMFQLLTKSVTVIGDPESTGKRLLGQRRRVSDDDPLIEFAEDLHACLTFVEALMEGKRRIQELELRAFTDDLTGLLNPAALNQIAPIECRRATTKKPLSILFVDLNGLKLINDKFTHHTGDEFIKLTAKKLAEGVRESDWVFRVGGDEFIVLMPHTTIESALQRSRQIAESITEIKVNEISASASFGLAVTGKIRKWKTLVNAADQAMYQSKALSKLNPPIQEVVIAA